jgi:N-acetyltransferase
MISLPDNLILENERVLLRPLQSEDLTLLLPFALEEPEIWTFSLLNAAGKEGMTAYIQNAVEQRIAKQAYPFIIFDKRTGEYAGSSRFCDIQLAFETTHLGYTWYGKRFQRTGLNRHCKLLLLTFAFEQWGMERVEFRADTRNEKSIKAMEDIGCRTEGILRSHYPVATGGRKDSIILSILKKEWFSTVKKQLNQKIR